MKVENNPVAYYVRNVGHSGVPGLVIIAGNILIDTNAGYLYSKNDDGEWRKWQAVGSTSDQRQLNEYFERYLADIVVGEGEKVGN